MTRAAWLNAATAQIRFPPDRKRVRQELEGHWEDAVDAARRRGLTAAEAEDEAGAALGDPTAIAAELGRLHSPWLGRLWRFLRICTVVVLVVLLAGVTDSAFRRNLLGREPDALEIPPEERVYDEMTFTRTGLWEDLDAGEAGGYAFAVPVAWAQRLTVSGENGYVTYSMELLLTARTWRVWEPWQPDMDTMSITDSSGCTYFSSHDPRSDEPFAPYFNLNSGHDAPGGTCADLYLGHMPATPEWLDVTIGDTVVRIDLEGGGAE